MKNKKLMAFLLTASFVLPLTACKSEEAPSAPAETAAAEASAPAEAAASDAASEEASAGAENSESAAPQTLKEGVLQVGMEIGYPPMEYFDTDGTTPIGFDVAVAYALGEKLGLDVELVDTAWDGIFASLDTDKYDCIISSVSITPERLENYNLTEPYVANKLVMVTPKDSQLTGPEEVEGLTVAVQLETTADYFMQDIADSGVNFELAQYDKVINCFDELKAGRTDAVLTDSVVASYYLGDDAASYKTAWENSEGEPMGICLKKGNDALTAAIEEAVDAIYEDGTMAEIAKTYFGSDITEGLR